MVPGTAQEWPGNKESSEPLKPTNWKLYSTSGSERFLLFKAKIGRKVLEEALSGRQKRK
jgi:hypothetical protein